MTSQINSLQDYLISYLDKNDKESSELQFYLAEPSAINQII